MKQYKHSDFKKIRAYHTSWLLALWDWIFTIPVVRSFRKRTAASLSLEYEEGKREQIEADIKDGAVFLTNHRDIVNDAALLSIKLRERYHIRPYIGMGNNLFVKWWIEPMAKFNHVFVVIRGGSPKELLQHSETLSAYISYLRHRGKSIWLAQREGRAKDSNDLTQPSVLKMLTLHYDDFIDGIKEMNICPICLNYQFDPCDYLKAMEMQYKRDDPKWRKSKYDDYKSMRTGILGWKGHIVFRMTPSINHWIEEHEEELRAMSHNDQAVAVAKQIDHQIHSNYEIFPHDEEFYKHIDEQLERINIPHKDEEFLRARLMEMYDNPIKNHMMVKNEDYEESSVPWIV